jgi:hypothetical protein
MPLAEYQFLVDGMVRDDAGKLTPTDRDQAVASAVIRYGKDRPRTKVEDIASSGGYYLPLPAGWEEGFSSLISLEYPIGEMPPAFLETGCWGMYNAPGGPQIMVKESLAAAGTVRAIYTIAHVLDATTDTILATDREPVASYAAAILLDQLAALYSGDSDSTIQADSVNHQSKAGEFATRARVLRKRYFDDLGIDTKRNVASGVVVNMDMASSLGRDRLMHPRRFR